MHTIQDLIDILIIVAWGYGNGYIFAWSILPLRPTAHWIASSFAFVVWGLGFWGLERRRARGRFPLGVSLIVFGLPFTCAVIGGIFWAISAIQSWLGLI